MSSKMVGDDADTPDQVADEYSKSSRSRFKFKSKKRSRSSERKEHSDRAFRKSRKTYHDPLDGDPTSYDESHIYNARSGEYVEPDTLFRESLFDALADDEGAAYWEGVYGQPIDVYSDKKPGPEGELERMTDEEYAEHVRKKMWEKTHQYLIEEREKRERDRAQRQKARDQERHQQSKYQDQPEARDSFLADIDEALSRGTARRKEQKWKEAWHRYVQDWEKFLEIVKSKQESTELADKGARGIIPWPVDTGRWKHAEKEDIENFFKYAVPADMGMLSLLKLERIRWHPDKMQQRFAANKLDKETLGKVTLVFQIVDDLWAVEKGKT